MNNHHLSPDAQPAGSGATLNPFVVVDGAADLVAFVVDVLGGVEVEQARSPMPDGRLIHAEVRLGTAHLLMADPMDDWPDHPGLLQVWVADVPATLDAAVARGARVVTPATPFYGATTLGRMTDPWGTCGGSTRRPRVSRTRYRRGSAVTTRCSAPSTTRCVPAPAEWPDRRRGGRSRPSRSRRGSGRRPASRRPSRTAR